MEEYDVDRTEANVDAPAAAMEVIGQEESIEESEVDYAEATMESEAHSLQPLFLSYLMLPRIVSVRLSLGKKKPECITQTSCLTPVKKSSSKTPLNNPSAVTNIRMLLTPMVGSG
ncbi:hypothetical protein H5410_050650 [Solanum commersonii]|uniref:Uncharacterized protein n=1 Tax=Solanum commersonii TaxID=4109 RepID=A0A9J5WXD4_SOLCO|nr:hypothetical protein H5410_050650 [Solanum commersonii]